MLHRHSMRQAIRQPGQRFNSLRLSELVGGEGISPAGVKKLWCTDMGHFYGFAVCRGGMECAAACVKEPYRFLHVRVDSLRVDCVVSPEGCSRCLWGSDSPH